MKTKVSFILFKLGCAYFFITGLLDHEIFFIIIGVLLFLGFCALEKHWNETLNK